MKKILITGIEGYIGSVMGPLLESAGFQVSGIDAGYYRDARLYNSRLKAVTRLMDVRRVTKKDLLGFDAVVHLAELSNDPLGQQDPGVTFEINYQGSVRLAKMAKQAGVGRFVYSSSCSVYGVAEAAEVDETSPVNPQTAYALCKVLVEREISSLADKNFSPVILRNATAFGASPRMRFDLVLNNLAGSAWTTGVIRLSSDGSPWRPLVHVEDICQAVLRVLRAPAKTVHNQVLNVGSNKQNYRVAEIAEIVRSVMPQCAVEKGKAGGDTRSYRVNFNKIKQLLPEFSCAYGAREGAQQLRGIFEKVGLKKYQFESSPYTRVKQLRLLLSQGKIDKHYFWTHG